MTEAILDLRFEIDSIVKTRGKKPKIVLNPKSKIQNPKSKIQNPKSKIQNPKLLRSNFRRSQCVQE
ncbi:MAG TPA: hypothetical protein DD379_03365 [Cyanobacteria bacterium UBA11162]|nr:hypothetical protein [Cyanobacteria bacterium UBA11162]